MTRTRSAFAIFVLLGALILMQAPSAVGGAAAAMVPLSATPAADECTPGHTIMHPVNERLPVYLDVIQFDSIVNGGILSTTFHLRQIPVQLKFDRVGLRYADVEYDWGVGVDVDGDAQTGATSAAVQGAEYLLSAKHFVSQPNTPVSKLIRDAVQVNTWQYDAMDESWESIADASLTVDPSSNTIVLAGRVPGIRSDSRLMFYTYDYKPGGKPLQDLSPCSRTIFEGVARGGESALAAAKGG
jgi:hypothetical protein